MAETVKKAAAKAKVAAKPKAVKAMVLTVEAPETMTVAEQVQAVTPAHHEIAELAQRFWAERGWQDGHAEHDWLRAERELMGIAS